MKRCIICDAIKPNEGNPLYDLDRCVDCLARMIKEDKDLTRLIREASNR